MDQINTAKLGLVNLLLVEKILKLFTKQNVGIEGGTYAMNKKKCPLCGSDRCEVKSSENFTQFVKCDTYKTSVHIDDEVYEDFGGTPDYQRMMNLVAERVVRQKTAKNEAYWVFYYNPSEDKKPENPAYVNLAPLLENYPQSMMDKAERALLNLSQVYPNYGVKFLLEPDYYRLCLPVHDKAAGLEEAEGIVRILVELGYITKNPEIPALNSISADGWKHIEELTKSFSEVKQGFVALKFGSDTEEIRKAIKTGIKAAGFEPMVIDEKEHNNQIVPEILYEIGKSKFLVIDVTYPNYGAYYEAGYAQGLGKEVIVCCNNEVFENKDNKYERPHFDIAQKSQIRWSDSKDLVNRLKRRIEATVEM